ncbi:4-formylbenzenesulfonate dehydrogenase TsaC1/TsaC2 [Chionoecetes opilio]|uniref:4-formylbenzenesulfonate dehydrogenase TsaC1/TsaC2 n=1 Tax=Chionoecetes opilio TaxID=41210 RepID=A0A8J4XNA7_CHIOP|nr:4-formylbenzenesulfonate dehydrogenase TsaC1/TsaC2 [Chionoecetes opilio]
MAVSLGSGLKEKVAIITGATSGIGLECARELAREGCFVAVSGRNTAALQEVCKMCRKAGAPQDKVLSVAADLAKDEDCEHLVSATVAHFGRLDVLVNSAGILTAGGIEKITMEEYDQQMNINTRSVFLLMKLALPHILETKGNIVNISSVTGLRSFPGLVAYNMSKAALDHLTRSVALEVADQGVRVNAVNPGVIVTDLHKRGGMTEETYAKFLEDCKETHAMGRAGEAGEVARAVVFLASDNSSFITGANLPIDGGRSVMCP